MADKAHYQTDLKLEEMEKRLSAIYSRAEKKSANAGKSILLNHKLKLTNCKNPMNLRKKAVIKKKYENPVRSWRTQRENERL